MNDDDLIEFKYKFDIPITDIPKRHNPTRQQIQLAMKIMQNNIWFYTNTTPRRIRLRRWLWRRKHSILMFYYRHFRCFRIWYHNRRVDRR